MILASLVVREVSEKRMWDPDRVRVLGLEIGRWWWWWFGAVRAAGNVNVFAAGMAGV